MYPNKYYEIALLAGVAQQLKHLMIHLTELEILTSLFYPLVGRPPHVDRLTGFDACPYTQKI